MNLLEEVMDVLRENDRSEEGVRYTVISSAWYFGDELDVLWYIDWEDFKQCAAEFDYTPCSVPNVHEQIAIVGTDFLILRRQWQHHGPRLEFWQFTTPDDDVDWDREFTGGNWNDPESESISISRVFSMDKPLHKFPYLVEHGACDSILSTAYAI